MDGISNTNNMFAFPSATPPSAPGYDYGEIDPTVAREMKAAVVTIRSLNAEIEDRAVLIGRELIRIKKLLPHGAWLPWLQAEFAWTARNAQHLMRGARGIGRNTPHQNDNGIQYVLTPPDMMARLDAEFQFTTDVCPHPRDPAYDGLTAEWGERNYANVPFSEGYAWAKKAIAENAEGKLVVMVLPVWQMRAIAMLDVAGAEIRYAGIPDWRAIEDGSTSPLPASCRQPCVIAILRPRSIRNGTNRTVEHDDLFGARGSPTPAKPWIAPRVLSIEDRARMRELEAVVAKLETDNARLREALRAAGLPDPTFCVP